ncbi:LOW QUALITY PROTEIN: hypothetical protein GX48_00160 [Paracoccidioides brasiliensis]|nr:LOW QUALITY PROTEIN: hypothetical protein GX48_00160 [Paracoccidioides brasiliensis]
MGDWETGRLGDWAGLAAGEREQVESEGREPEEHWGPVALPLASKTSPLQPQQQQQQQQLMERDVRLRGPRDGHQDPSRALIPEVANNNRRPRRVSPATSGIHIHHPSACSPLSTLHSPLSTNHSPLTAIRYSPSVIPTAPGPNRQLPPPHTDKSQAAHQPSGVN